MADESTKYLIDISAEMDGGDDAISQLTQIADQLTGTGSAAKTFDAAIGQTKAALAAAGDAATKAAADLAAGETRYKQLEQAAVRAATALERAGQKSSGSVPADLAQKAAAAAAALRGEAQALDALRAKSAAAVGEQKRLANAMKQLEVAGKVASKQEELAAATARGSGDLGKLSGALSQVGGPLGMVGGKAAGLANAFGEVSAVLGTGPGALVGVAVAAAAAIVALTAAIGVAIVKTAAWAVGLADARRNSALATAALEQTHEALVGVGKAFPDVTRATGLASDDLRDLAKQLAGAGVSAADMPEALRAVALAEAALGKGGAADLVADLKSGKKAVGDLAKEMETKFGGIVADKLLSLDEQSKTFKRNLGETFGGLEVKPLLKELDRLVSLFDANTASGRTMKFLFEKMFQPLIDAAVAAGPVVERFFLGAQIAALKLYLRIQPAIKSVKTLLGQTDGGTIDWLKAAEIAGKAVAAAIGLAVVGVLGLVSAIAPVIELHQRIALAAEAAWGTMYNKAASVIEFLGSVSLMDIGLAMVQGLADGISGGASKVVDAMTGAVRDAISAAEKLLDIGSPSKLFKEIGGFTVQGFAEGVESEAPAAQGALEAMVDPPLLSGSPAGPGGTSRAGGGHTFQITIHAPSGAAEDIAHAVEITLDRILEGDVEKLGGQPPVEGAP